MGEMRREYREFDDVRVGDVIDLGGKPRRVLGVTRDGQDRVRFVSVNRLACGYARYRDGKVMKFCTGPVHLYHTDLRTPQYQFRGIINPTTPAPEEGAQDG